MLRHIVRTPHGVCCYDLVLFCLFSGLLFCGLPFVLFLFFTVSITDVAGGAQGLKSLVDLVPDILAVSRAPSTVKGYHAQFIKWKAWAANFPDVVSFPATDLHFALYLVSLLQAGYSFSTISSAFYGVNFFHSSCGVRNPCDSGFVKAVLEGCKRCSASSISTRKKLPICPEHLHSLVHKFAGVDATLPDIRDVCFCLVAFAGFLRFNELCNLRWCDIVFKDTHFSLFIPRSKSDQYGSGATRVVARTGNPTCPFDMLRRYATLSGDNISSTQFVFRSVYKSKAGGYLLRDGSKLSYSRARELFIQKFRAIGLDTSLYGLHSLRIGGASAAANSDIPDRVIKKHGRWKSDKAKDTYCREDIQHQLLVTLNIGI